MSAWQLVMLKAQSFIPEASTKHSLACNCESSQSRKLGLNVLMGCRIVSVSQQCACKSYAILRACSKAEEYALVRAVNAGVFPADVAATH